MNASYFFSHIGGACICNLTLAFVEKPFKLLAVPMTTGFHMVYRFFVTIFCIINNE